MVRSVADLKRIAATYTFSDLEWKLTYVGSATSFVALPPDISQV
jgi:hypothetical protein